MLLKFTYYKEGDAIKFEAIIPNETTLGDFTNSFKKITDRLERDGDIDENTKLEIILMP